MKINSNMMAWLLAGALLASLSLHLSGGVAASDDTLPAATGQAKPAGLTRELSIPIEVLGLSEAQVSSLREFCASDCACKPSLEESLEKVTEQLEFALTLDPIDADNVRELGRQLASLRGRKIEACVESILLVRDVLDPKQIEELRSGCNEYKAR